VGSPDRSRTILKFGSINVSTMQPNIVLAHMLRRPSIFGSRYSACDRRPLPPADSPRRRGPSPPVAARPPPPCRPPPPPWFPSWCRGSAIAASPSARPAPSPPRGPAWAWPRSSSPPAPGAPSSWTGQPAAAQSAVRCPALAPAPWWVLVLLTSEHVGLYFLKTQSINMLVFIHFPFFSVQEDH